ncbi:MAG: DNA-processing protein DprA, partial [Bacteroidales bacterium]|nr:DNA-processing protein DprA [Bacteroidales bacterium]
MEAELVSFIALANCYVYDSAAARELLEKCGSAKEALALSKQRLKENYLEDAEHTLRRAERSGFEILTVEDDGYPSRLRECPDAPIVLYKKGMCNLNASRMIAIVGTRSSTEYGAKYCEQIVNHLALCNPKPVIISGMAHGIDSCAHRAALNTGLSTVAVMGTGFDIIYPPGNERLSERISQAGCLLTEFSGGTPSYPYNF